MKKFFVLLITILSINLFAQQLSTADQANKIKEDYIKKLMLNISDKDSNAIVKHFFEMENITIKSFAPVIKIGNNLIEGLRLVVEQKKDPKIVYSELKLSDCEISEQNWQFYIKNYTTTSKIDELSKMIPTNMDMIIEQAKPNVISNIENWLLEQYILNDFDHNYPDKKSITTEDKLLLWWQNELKSYQFANTDKLVIILSIKSPMNEADTNSWKAFFQQKDNSK